MHHRTLAGLVALMGALTVLPAMATDKSESSGEKQGKAQKRKAAPAKLPAPGGSGETTAERTARLKRECKGRPNAGACTGYTD